MANIQDSSCGRTSVGRFPQTQEKISAPSSKKSAKSRTVPFLFLDLRSGRSRAKSWEIISQSPTELLMHNTGESPSEENASTLSQILMENVPEKYSLSPRACQGILRRASERGKELPEVLKIALERQAQV